MFNLKAGAIGAGIAFVLSFIISLVTGASALYLFLKPLAFAAVFFLIVNGVWILLNRYLPDLIGSSSDSPEAVEGLETGRQVDISVGDQEVVPDFKPRPRPRGLDEGEDGELGDIAPGDVEDESSLPKDDDEPTEISEEVGTETEGEPPDEGEPTESEIHLDHAGEAGYTDNGDGIAQSRSAGAAMPSRPANLIDDVDQLPDLQMFSDSFVMPIADEAVSGESSGSAPHMMPVSSKGGKSGDFDTKEMVSAIQTMLKKDQKG